MTSEWVGIKDEGNSLHMTAIKLISMVLKSGLVGFPSTSFVWLKSPSSDTPALGTCSIELSIGKSGQRHVKYHNVYGSIRRYRELKHRDLLVPVGNITTMTYCLTSTCSAVNHTSYRPWTYPPACVISETTVSAPLISRSPITTFALWVRLFELLGRISQGPLTHAFRKAKRFPYRSRSQRL